MLKQIFVFLIFMVVTTQSFASGIPATNGIAQPSTCDTGTLETSTGPVQLRAEFTPEVINLRWYNDDARINVPTTSSTCTYGTAISLPQNQVINSQDGKCCNMIFRHWTPIFLVRPMMQKAKVAHVGLIVLIASIYKNKNGWLNIVMAEYMAYHDVVILLAQGMTPQTK